jgi:acetolactate synthase-1/2/3 large subunit
MKRSGAEIVWEILVRENVDTVFGYPGGGVLPLYDAMLKYPVRHVLTRHEQGAVHMADGYARASGKVGVAIGTSGPGATNMVTGIATANLDSSPLVCITGQVYSQLLGFDAFQEVDTTGITMPITKHNYLVTDVDELAEVLREAFYLARSGRPGPVLVDIPKDVQIAQTDWVDEKSTLELPGYQTVFPYSDSDIDQALMLLMEAKQPLILAGQGVTLGNAGAELKSFVEQAHIPVAVTLLGIGTLPASHPLYLGMMGMHGDAWVNRAIQQSDLLIALGMRFDDRVTGKLDTFAPGARKIHVDIDRSEIDKNISVDLGVVADLKSFLQQVNTCLPPLNHSEWVEGIQKDKADCDTVDFNRLPDDGVLHAIHVIHDIWQQTPEDAIIVTDVGQHQMWTAQYYKFDHPKTLLTSGGLGTMGFALPAAVGAKVACPEQEVWVIAGDGGFQMTQSELATLRQEGIKVNIAIINNGYLGMVRQWQDFFFERRYSAVAISSPDFVKLADAHGLRGMRVTRRSEIQDALEFARGEPGSVVLEFQVEQEETVYPMVPAGASLDAMIRRTVSSNGKDHK